MSRISFIVVEDDESICQSYKKLSKKYSDLYLIDTTKSINTALEMVINYKPHAIVLDLELHNGDGNGITFLKNMSKTGINKKPFVLVVTNNVSQVTHNIARGFGADLIFTKTQSDYTTEMVLGFLSSLNEVKCVVDDKPPEKEIVLKAERIQTLRSAIATELDLIGISAKLKGRAYLAEAIELISEKKTPKVCSVIAKRYSKTDASVERAMQTAINHAWRDTDIDTLERSYTAYISPKKGVPTVTEFIYFYAEKMKKTM